MARTSKIQSAIDAAVADASSAILRSTLAGLSGGMTVGALGDAMSSTSMADAYRSMTLSELQAALAGVGSAPKAKRGRPSKKASKAAAPAKKAGRKGGGKLNTRTAAGRAKLDAAIAAVLQDASGGLRSEQINSQVPGDTAQIRHSLARMIEAGQVSKVGEKRATAYSWGASASAKAGPCRAPKRKKTRGNGRKKAAAK